MTDRTAPRVPTQSGPLPPAEPQLPPAAQPLPAEAQLPPAAQPLPAEAKLPPAAQLIVAALALVVTGGIYLAAHLPGRPALGPPIGLAAAAAVLLASAAALLSRVRPFAWGTFRRVGGWALTAYLVIAGMLEYVFVFDHTPARVLGVLTAMLALFAVAVPMLMAFSVARYQPPD
ncbi:MAG: hypothetical protein ACYCO3_06095 [Mycobacteriales bacterium]